MLLLLTILCVGMMFVTFVTNVNLEPVQTVSGYVIVPIQKGINNIGLWLSDKVDYRQTLQELQAENQQLKEKVNELTIENSELVQDTYELGRLRDMYQLDAKYPGYTKVAARVIGKDGSVELIQLRSDIPYGHKLAVRDIHPGDQILKYGESIGAATQEITAGDYVHVHNLDSQRARGDL